MMQTRVEPPPISLIKIKHDDKSEKYFVKIKLRRDPKSSFLGLYEFKMTLFDNDNSEKFILLLQNFNRTLAASGTQETDKKVQYICTLVRG